MMCLESNSLRKSLGALEKAKNPFWSSDNWTPYQETWIGVANYVWTVAF